MIINGVSRITHIDGKSNWQDMGLEPWPGRYFVNAEFEGLRVGGSLFNVSVTMSSFNAVTNIDDLIEDLGFPIVIDNNIDDYQISLIFQTFTEQQSDELIEYLNSLKGFLATKKQAFKPVEGIDGMSALPFDIGCGSINIFENEGYPLDFDVIGYFTLSKSNRVGPSPDTLLKNEIKEVLKICPPTEKVRILKMVLDLINERVV